MATMTIRTRLSFALYAHCLSCIVILQSTHKSRKGVSFRSPSCYFGCISYVSFAWYTEHISHWPWFDDCNSTWQGEKL